MKLNLITCAAAVIFLISFSLIAAGAEGLKVGDAAPLIKAKDQNGNAWNLADQLGKKAVILYFYPKDSTPGCTKEACGFRDRMEDLQKQDVAVVGVSFDTAASHQKFISKYNLNFPLLVDSDGKIADAYKARKVILTGFARRVSFLIGKDGKIAHITDSSSADTHLAEMQEAVKALK